ncbi:hypothetical protein CPB83DRAFT_857148 [Crepidotus variabilis]|uniref:Uncharacterized protein n=1 Tax=Crepidotus variabilis TaxID=179855 RepID=A0A9P6EDN0_9AGAR|nr:hypothetical protein CPB83DRAFT_857148 [Crepidotus variabilis]
MSPTPVLQEFYSMHQVTPRLIKICSFAHKVLLHAMEIDDVTKRLPLCSQAKEITLWMFKPSYNYYLLQPLETLDQRFVLVHPRNLRV